MSLFNHVLFQLQPHTCRLVSVCPCPCLCVCVCVGDTAGCRLTGPEHHLNPLLHVQKHRAHDGCLGLGTEARHGRWKLIRNRKMSQTFSLRCLFHEVLLLILSEITPRWLHLAVLPTYIYSQILACSHGIPLTTLSDPKTLQNFSPVLSK